MGLLQGQLDHRDAWDLDARLDQAMEALNCPPSEAEYYARLHAGKHTGHT